MAKVLSGGEVGFVLIITIIMIILLYSVTKNSNNNLLMLLQYKVLVAVSLDTNTWPSVSQFKCFHSHLFMLHFSLICEITIQSSIWALLLLWLPSFLLFNWCIKGSAKQEERFGPYCVSQVLKAVQTCLLNSPADYQEHTWQHRVGFMYTPENPHLVMFTLLHSLTLCPQHLRSLFI